MPGYCVFCGHEDEGPCWRKGLCPSTLPSQEDWSSQEDLLQIAMVTENPSKSELTPTKAVTVNSKHPFVKGQKKMAKQLGKSSRINNKRLENKNEGFW